MARYEQSYLNLRGLQKSMIAYSNETVKIAVVTDIIWSEYTELVTF